MSGVEGRVALVTGAGRGIGRATALLLAEHGASVMGVSRTGSELESLGIDYVVGDLGDPQDCVRVAAETAERLGPIEVFVCNHGIGSADERVVWEQDPAIWDETMRINLDGPFHLTREIVGGMVAAGYGRCVYVSSTAGQLAEPSASAYVASKHGLIGLMRSVAQDAGEHGITSNAVLPGWVRTEMAERSAAEEARRRGITADEIWAQRAALYPPKRVVEPIEVARAILFLAGEESGGINGEAITVALGSPW
jgi:NAD(P)-dependent dehydrogenase (short-subunit alcohol dehydrogenase family)